MARIFVSYSRVDAQFVKELCHRLHQMRPAWHIWWDQASDGLLGGDLWWDKIMDAIANSDIFIYVLSNESLQSKYCKAEFEEARRLQKRIITIQARDRTRMEGEIAEIHYVDMKNGVNDAEAIAQLSGALDRQASLIARRRPRWKPRTAKPADEPDPDPRSESAPDVDTPTLRVKSPDATAHGDRIVAWATIIAAIIMGSLGILGVMIGIVLPPLLNVPVPSPTITVAQNATETPTESVTPTLNNFQQLSTTEAELTQAAGTQAGAAAHAIINVPSANIRIGPGTDYLVVRTAISDETFRIVARTQSSDWYVIEVPNLGRAWISSSVVKVVNSENGIEIARTIPAPPPTKAIPATPGITATPTNPRFTSTVTPRATDTPSSTYTPSPTAQTMPADLDLYCPRRYQGGTKFTEDTCSVPPGTPEDTDGNGLVQVAWDQVCDTLYPNTYPVSRQINGSWACFTSS